MILREIKNMYIKNRLTEGVDFVRKEWLVGDGIAYINFPDTVAFSIKIKEFDTNVTNYARGYKLDTDSLLRLYVGKGGSTTNCSGLVIDKADGHVATNYRSPLSDIGLGEHIITKTAETDRIGVFTDGVRHRKNASTDIDYIGTDLIFNQLIPNSNLYIGYLMSTSLNFIPCQLLKSIPATLDANNIARSAGECGMYDSVSGKFYGNVANSGTFTVEGEVEPETHSGLQQIYQNKLIEGVDYETADWLKYTNWVIPANENALYGAQLNCELKVTTILKFTIKLGEIIHKNNSNVELIVRSSTRTYYIRRSYLNNNIAAYSPTSTMISNNYNLGSNLDFLITEEGLFVNNVQLINEKIEYIKQFGNSGRSCTGSISSVTTEEGVDVLVPCTLLRSIPRNLDAQCMTRQAGECGMIDLISGKFYGNVASSGTFTVENDNNE